MVVSLLLVVGVLAAMDFAEQARWESVANTSFAVLLSALSLALVMRLPDEPGARIHITFPLLLPAMKGSLAVARWNFAIFVAVAVLVSATTLAAAAACVIAVHERSWLGAVLGLYLIVALPIATTNITMAIQLFRLRRAGGIGVDQ